MKGLFLEFFCILTSVAAYGAQDAYLSWATSYWRPATVGSPMLKSSQWGENADLDGNGIVNLIEYVRKTDPTRYNPVSDAWQFSIPPSGAAEYGVKGGINFDAKDRFALEGKRLICEREMFQLEPFSLL